MILLNDSYGIVVDWSPKGYAVQSCSHINSSCNPHKGLKWSVNNCNHTSITTHAEYPIIWHGGSMVAPIPQTFGGAIHNEVWKMENGLEPPRV